MIKRNEDGTIYNITFNLKPADNIITSEEVSQIAEVLNYLIKKVNSVERITDTINPMKNYD